MKKNILVTGGLGFIGSHTVVELLSSGYGVTVIDNLSNSHLSVRDAIERITDSRLDTHIIDILNYPELLNVFRTNHFDAVIHFAGVKSVYESVIDPLKYYSNNVIGSYNLIECMKASGVHKLIFSSSATVYGEADVMPITEDYPTNPSNPYGRSKLYVEQMCSDLCASDSSWSIALLRYFNPVGAHQSGLIGENPMGMPNNLFPIITRVAAGIMDELLIFGDAYATTDGTGVRDYIHVMDLASGHIKALDFINDNAGVEVFNLGTGKGYSVKEIVRAFESQNCVKIPYKIVENRPGDVAVCFSDPSKANKSLGWHAEKSLSEMCKDGWNYHQMSLTNRMG
jgi:UDP-glucose 4-epimerase